ncbi:MAG: RDD family protein [Mycobacteriaceae bacterium]|uniref:RDD family protein n=1 Tax=Corynebacterium sp. TaxID=1720 RepID=UPI003F9BB6B0
MTNPYNQNPDVPENNQGGASNGLPSYGDYNQGYNESYASGYDQFPQDPSQNYLGAGYPGAGKRLGALIIDSLIFGVITVILMSVIAGDDINRFMEDVNSWVDDGANGTAPELEMGSIIFVGILSVVLWFVYRVLMETSKGQTLGKMALGIKVVNADGQLISARDSLVRNSWFLVVAIISNIPMIGSIGMLAIYIVLGVLISRSPHNQHTCDQWAKAYVVNAR